MPGFCLEGIRKTTKTPENNYSSNGADVGNHGVGVAVEVLKGVG